ncbi:MAG: hypothetical protein HYX35_01410 [Proteobacteria bacterium]|nr:hypothetical protein [Pseudomonadota bacterium]
MLSIAQKSFLVLTFLGGLYLTPAIADGCPDAFDLQKHGKSTVAASNCTTGYNNSKICNITIPFSYTDRQQNLYTTTLTGQIQIGTGPIGIDKIVASKDNTLPTCFYDFDVIGIIDVTRSPKVNSKWFTQKKLKITKPTAP